MHPPAPPVPVRLHETETQYVLAAPMAGLEPGDIRVTLDGREVTIQGGRRGPVEPERRVLLAEWSAGPYERRITLPGPVNAPATNASYGNGVLVLSIPKATDGRQGSPVTFRLEAAEPTRGVWLGRPPGNPQAA
ncbi:MAG: Hsp20/alpha crystallin family protein [Candidatus Methylomirabilales bacterium]